jgi:uncharacterized membrane protein YgdD (TMEM256/DUF423 family)
LNNQASFSPRTKALAIVAAISGFLSVALGAFSAHGLHRYATSELISVWDSGVRYHMFHAIAALIAALIANLQNCGLPAKRWALFAGWFFVGGIVFFSGGLYLLVLYSHSWLMQMAAVGGVLFLLGWAALVGAFAVANR